MEEQGECRGRCHPGTEELEEAKSRGALLAWPAPPQGGGRVREDTEMFTEPHIPSAPGAQKKLALRLQRRV